MFNNERPPATNRNPDFKLRKMIDVGSDKIKMWNPVCQMRKYVSGRQSAGMK